MEQLDLFLEETLFKDCSIKAFVLFEKAFSTTANFHWALLKKKSAKG